MPVLEIPWAFKDFHSKYTLVIIIVSTNVNSSLSLLKCINPYVNLRELTM